MTAWLESSLHSYIQEHEQSLLSGLSELIHRPYIDRRLKYSLAATLYLLALEKDCLRLQSTLRPDESHEVRYPSDMVASQTNSRYRTIRLCL